MLTGRVLTAVAALLMLAVVVLTVVPTTSVVHDDGPGRRVSCGTLLFTTDYSFSDGCEGPRIARITTAFFAWTSALLLGAVGLALLYLTTRSR